MHICADGDLPLTRRVGRAVTIGAYDGVHLGHQAILAALREQAAGAGLETVVVTFDRHPAEVVRPGSAPHLLTDLDQKLELLAGTGVDHTVVVHFDHQRSRETADRFVQRVLVDGLDARLVVVGEDFHFGYRRQGNVGFLTDVGADLGFEVRGHHLVGADGRPALDEAQVSSTAIRRALREGRLADANAMLGRDHEVRGTVVEGDRRGRELGFPTANVAIPERMLMPAEGIYAGWCADDPLGEEGWHPAAIYVGRRPTFFAEGAAVLVEAHLLDFAGDLYGRRLRVRLSHRIRDDRRFESAGALARQLRGDCDEARRLLATAGPGEQSFP